MQTFINIVQNLKANYLASWFYFLLKRTALGRLLVQTNDPSPWCFFNTYFSSWWWNRWWFKAFIKQDQQQNFALLTKLIGLLKPYLYREGNVNRVTGYAYPHLLLKLLAYLQQAGILNQENFDSVVGHARLHDLAEVFSYLQQAELFTQENFDRVAGHACLHDLAFAIYPFLQAGILTQANFTLLVGYAHPYYRGLAFSVLQQAGILTQDNMAVVAGHADPDCLASGLANLQRAGILTQENRALVLMHVNPANLAAMLSLLEQAKILTPKNRVLVARHLNSADLGAAMAVLQQAGILTQDNLAVVAGHHSSDQLHLVFYNLAQVGILTQENINLSLGHSSLNDLVYGLSVLLQSRILTQENFNTFVMHPNPGFLRLALSIMHQVKILNLDNFALVASHANPLSLALVLANTHDLDAVLFILEDAGLLTQMNRDQVTKYINLLDLAEAFSSLQQAGILTVDNLAALFEPNHAPLLSQDARHFVWCRIPRHILTQTNYQSLLIAAEQEHPEQELERVINEMLGMGQGLNSSHSHPNNQAADSPICVAGTFNNIIEKLKGVHSDVEVNYITPADANAKFPSLVAEHAFIYLQSLVHPETIEDYRRTSRLLMDLQTDGTLAAIWDEVKESVSDALWDEFHEAYGNDRQDTRFRALIDYGHQLASPDVLVLQTQLQASNGYQAYSSRLAAHRLWSNRHHGPQAQQSFDQQFGLVIYCGC